MKVFGIGLSIALVSLATTAVLAQPSDQDTARAEATAYAAARGETLEQFSARVGSSPQDVIAFVYAAERTGGTAGGALSSLENFSEAIKDPAKARLVQCLGVHLTTNPNEEMPSEEECAALKRSLGFSE
jgi:hypothetical protein